MFNCTQYFASMAFPSSFSSSTYWSYSSLYSSYSVGSSRDNDWTLLPFSRCSTSISRWVLYSSISSCPSLNTGEIFSRCSVYGYFCTMPRKGAFQSLDVLNLSDRDPGWISRRENICRKVSVIDLKCRGFKCLVQSTFRHQTAILNNSATTEITSEPQIPRGWHLFTGLIRWEEVVKPFRFSF